MNLGLKGKKVLITGGATGIGKTIAEEFVKENANVVITSRSNERLQSSLRELGGKKNGNYGVVCDLNQNDMSVKLHSEIINNFGNIDILVNNIGSKLDISDPYCSIKHWRNIFRVNFEIAVELNNLFIPYMKNQDWGRILNITSLAGLENSGPVTYCVTKAALTAYSRTMGRILASETNNVVMTALMPGVVFTEDGDWAHNLENRPEHVEKYLKERCPLGRMGTTNEISPMAVFMCSELASFMHGAIVPVDAGQSKHFMFFNYLD